MRRSVGAVVILGALAVAGAASADWLGKSHLGLSRLMSGTVAVTAARAPDLYADWRDPNAPASAPSIAMSESDWLKLTDDVAPVIYLPEPPEIRAPAAPTEQQPL